MTKAMDFKVIFLTVVLQLGNDFEHLHLNTNLVNGMSNGNISYCPYVQTCSYGVEVIDASYTFHRQCCRPCDCERDCEQVKCCPDIVPCKNPTVNQMNQQTVCIRTTFKRSSLETGILSIATCKEGSDEGERVKCLQEYNINKVDVYDIIPVSEVNAIVTYRNIHCAQCNWIDLNTIKYWLLNVFCESSNNVDITDESNLLKTISKSQGCDFKFNAPDPDIAVKQCSFIIESCNVTGLWTEYDSDIEFKCLTSREKHETFEGAIYRNTFCGICNGQKGGNIEIGNQRKPYFSVLMSFDARKDPESYQSTRCAPGMLFLKSKELCVEACCSLLRRLRNNACERRVYSLESFTYRIGFRLRPEASVNVEKGFIIVTELAEQLNTFLRSVFGFFETVVYEITLIADLNFHDGLNASRILMASLLWYEVRLKLLITESHDPEEQLETILNITSKAILKIEIQQTVIRIQIILKDDIVYFSYQSTPVDLLPCSYSLIEFSPCLEFDPRNAFKAYHPSNFTAVPYVGPKIGDKEKFQQWYKLPIASETNILEFKKCISVNISKNKLAWKDTDFGIEFVNERLFLNSSEFVFEENGESIWVCLDKFNILFNAGCMCYSCNVLFTNTLTFVMAIHLCTINVLF